MAKKASKKDKKVEEAPVVEGIVVDEAFLNLHPELVDEGVSVGDAIDPQSVAPSEEEKPVENTEKPAKSKKSSVDLDGEVSIIKNGEYIRTYPEGSEEAVRGFLGKDDKYVAVDPSSILSITVSWRESIKKKDDTGQMVDTGEMKSKVVVFSEKTHGKEWMKEARTLASEAPRRSCVVNLA